MCARSPGADDQTHAAGPRLCLLPVGLFSALPMQRPGFPAPRWFLPQPFSRSNVVPILRQAVEAARRLRPVDSGRYIRHQLASSAGIQSELAIERKLVRYHVCKSTVQEQTPCLWRALPRSNSTSDWPVRRGAHQSGLCGRDRGSIAGRQRLEQSETARFQVQKGGNEATSGFVEEAVESSQSILLEGFEIDRCSSRIE